MWVLKMTTDWMDHGCTHVGYGFPLYPRRVPPGGVKPYYWNSKCLEAPRPYLINGIYGQDPRRRVIPGLVPISAGFVGLPSSEDLMIALRERIRNHSNALTKVIELTSGDGNTLDSYIPDIKEYLNS